MGLEGPPWYVVLVEGDAVVGIRHFCSMLVAAIVMGCHAAPVPTVSASPQLPRVYLPPSMKNTMSMTLARV